MADTDTLLKFPCRFSIKALGRNDIEFDLLVLELISPYVEKLDKNTVKTRASRNGKYISVTVTINATSKQQLDSIYQHLSGHPQVLMVL